MNAIDVVVLAAYASLLVEIVVFPIPSEASTWQIVAASPNDGGGGNSDALERARRRSKPQKLLRYFVPTATCVLLWLVPLAVTFVPALGAVLWCARPAALEIPGVVLIVLGRAITFASVLQLRAQRRTRGEPRWLFLRSRNPGLVGMFTCYAGLCCLFSSPLLWLGLPLYVANMHARVRMEEAHLAAASGARWRDYAARVPRYVGRPQPTRLGARDE